MRHLTPAIRIADRLADRQPHNRDITTLRYHLRLLNEDLRRRAKTMSTNQNTAPSGQLIPKKRDWAAIKRRQRARQRAQALSL